MSKRIHWSTRLMTTTSPVTGKTFYYMLMGRVFTRVSKEVYESREDDSTRVDSFHTETTKRGLVRQCKTVYGTHVKSGGNAQ